MPEPKHTPLPWTWTHDHLNRDMKKKGYHDPKYPWWFCLQSLSHPFNRGASPKDRNFNGYAGAVISCKTRGKRSQVYNGAFPSKADRDFIVRACNSHYELLEACKRDGLLADIAIALTPTGTDRNKLTEVNILRVAAIAKAEREADE